MNCAAEIAVAEKGVSVRVPVINSQSSAGGMKEEERSICRDASDETREPMPEGPTIFEGSEEDVSTEYSEVAHAAFTVDRQRPSRDKGGKDGKDDRSTQPPPNETESAFVKEQQDCEHDRQRELNGGNGASSGSGKQAEIKNDEGTRAEDALHTPPLQTPLKRKKKEKTVSRLSFSDELGAEDGDGEGGNEFGSISQSTNKRFLQEERKRRRHEQESASVALNTSPDLLTSQLSSHKERAPSHHAAFPPSPGATTAKSHRPQCVLDDDQAAWLPLGVRHQVSERQGKRPYMEDTSLYETDWHHKGWHLFGVFDGHGGSRASSYVRDEIPAILRSRILESEQDMPAGVKEITEAFSSSFNEIDRRFLDIARAEQLKDGTTALLGLLRNNTLHMGWVGDSRCILSRQGRYVRVSEDHKPDRPDERRAVEARGGQVIFRGTYRVAGPTALAVSRAIGDILMKEPRKLVISEPEIKTIDLLPQDEFLVMASDGLFDVMEDQSVIDTVGNHLKEHKSYQGAADKLTELAIEKGSLDNVTVVIIEFLWGADATDD